MNAAFKELTGDATVGTWVQFWLSTEEPVDGNDYKPPAGAATDRLLGFNSWVDQTWGGLDGTFEVDGLKRDDGPKTKFYTAPGNAGKTVEAHLGVKAGVWSGAGALTFNILVDEISLKQVATAVESKTYPLPAGFTLEQNYPNPFNPLTEIRYAVPSAGRVTLTVFSLKGEKIRTLADETMPAGSHKAVWDGLDSNGVLMPSGVYVYRLEAGGRTSSKRLVLMR